jgi:predicted HicB family RNase H-like nuclease
MMEYKGYLSRIEFDDKSEIFHGEVVNIRDVVTFQGKSVEDLRTAFEESIKDYLEFCAARGEDPDQPFSGRLTVRLTPEQHRRVILAAERAGQKVDNWISHTLERAAGNPG